jgi:flagellar protein FlaG
MTPNNINTNVVPKETPPMASPMQPPVKETMAEEETTPNTLQPVDKKEAHVSVEEAKGLSEELNDYMDDLQTDLGFSIHEDLDNQIVVEIKNRETGELIKQIPTEEMLQIKEKMKELTGLLFDQRV